MTEQLDWGVIAVVIGHMVRAEHIARQTNANVADAQKAAVTAAALAITDAAEQAAVKVLATALAAQAATGDLAVQLANLQERVEALEGKK